MDRTAIATKSPAFLRDIRPAALLSGFVLWAAIGVGLACYVSFTYDTGYDFLFQLRWQLALCLTYWPLVPLLRWTLGRRSWRPLGVLALAPLGFLIFLSLHWCLLRFGLLVLAIDDARYAASLLRYLSRMWPWESMVFTILLGQILLGRIRGTLRERELETAELRRQLAEARLAALESKVQPHFLFNTLHAIGMSVRSEPDRAELMLFRLGELLRATLALGDARSHRVEEELGLSRSYLEIQEQRFGERMDYREEVEPGVEALQLPPLILQPLLENAIKHGVETRSALTQIEMRLWSEGDDLCVRISNDRGADSTREGHGIGLASVRERVAGWHRLASCQVEEGEALFSVELRLPQEPPPESRVNEDHEGRVS